MVPAAVLQTEMEQVIGRLRSVISSRVVIEGDSVQEIHVLAEMDRPAKWIVRDVETALVATFGLPIDHRIISVAQLEGAETRRLTEARLVLSSIKVEMTPDGSSIQVELALGDEAATGSAQGPRNPRERGRLAALAVLDAVGAFLKPGVSVVLDHLSTMSLGARRICLASVLYCHQGREERLLGGAVVEEESTEPAVKAVLMALNRRLAHMLASSAPT